MKILVTGAKGFVGKNLVENLKCIRDKKNLTRPNLSISEIYEFDIGNTYDELDKWTSEADFVFHFAGVNRPDNDDDFKTGNVDLTNTVLDLLKKHNNTCPFMLSSSIQAQLSGRFENSEYGKSKLNAEAAVFNYSKETGARVFVYRFPNIVGKWTKPNYNSAVATFCHNIARNLPIKVNDPNVELELLFIDDLIEELFNLLEGKPNSASEPDNISLLCKSYNELKELYDLYYKVPVSYKTSLGNVVNLLKTYHQLAETLIIPSFVNDSFEKKLFSLYVSYLPADKICFNYKSNADYRGCFTELLKNFGSGQISVNVINPGCTKGQHWHNSKWELFIVLKGEALIQERQLATDQVVEFKVTGSNLKAVHMLPGYAHNITNLSDKDEVILLIWSNEIFDYNKPDTFYENV